MFNFKLITSTANDFFTALQFLTRLKIVRQTAWSMEGFGRSVKYFPVVGAVIGCFLVTTAFYLKKFFPAHAAAALLVVTGIVITGGLHCDGFMDTVDGIFSGRTRKKMLEIMKDSRIGANGAAGFFCLLLCRWSLYLDMPFSKLLAAVFIAPVIGRQAMVMAITCFPYARPAGIGKAFAEFADKKSLLVAAGFSLAAVLPWGLPAAVGLSTGLAVAVLAAYYISRLLGGLTGDVYGALTELTEVVVLAACALV